MTTFADKVAIVTGAGSGMGRATALLLADRGGPTAECSTAKHAIRGLTRTAAKEYGSEASASMNYSPA